jgi:hypothetical protein
MEDRAKPRPVHAQGRAEALDPPCVHHCQLFTSDFSDPRIQNLVLLAQAAMTEFAGVGEAKLMHAGITHHD